MKVNCANCGKELDRKPSRVKKHKNQFCNMKCNGEWQSKNIKGNNAPGWHGGNVTKMCEQCGNKFDDLPYGTRKFCDKKCYWNWMKGKPQQKWSNTNRKKQSDSKLGKKNPMWGKTGSANPAWKGGVAKHNQMNRISPEVRRWKRAVYRMDDYTCQICHTRSSKGNPVTLNAHHIKAFAKYPKLITDLDNGITLCVDCHKWIHKLNVIDFQ